MQALNKVRFWRSPFILGATLMGVIVWGTTASPVQADDQTMPANPIGQYEDESQEKYEEMNQEPYRDADDDNYQDQTQIKYENESQVDYENMDQEGYENMNQRDYREDN